MNTSEIKMDKYAARARYNRLKKLDPGRFRKQRPEIRDRLIKEQKMAQRIYFHVAQSRRVLNLQESFVIAGLDQRGWPKLAIEQADHKFTWCRSRSSTIVTFGQLDDWHWHRKTSINVLLHGHTLHMNAAPRSLRAVVPTIPPDLMPKGKLERYHILWEAEWTTAAPKDPILLQHLTGDAWLILAQWDLTEVERMVLTARFDR